MRAGVFFTVALLTGGIVITDAYLPVIVLHGIFSDAPNMKDLVAMITTAHPGTIVYNIDGYDNDRSMTNMWEQVDFFKQQMLPIFKNSTDGVNMICFSQGGLACRAILETTPNHNVKTFISLSSPQGGQYGDTIYMKILPNTTRDLAFMVFYNSLGQKISIGNYWKDPHRLDDYMKASVFLPKIDLPSDSSYRENFMAIEDLVLIGGPDDGVITPWQSSQFGFYDQNLQVNAMEKQEYFLNDTFGLKSMNASQKIHNCTLSGIVHVKWHRTQEVYDKCMEPFLN